MHRAGHMSISSYRKEITTKTVEEPDNPLKFEWITAKRLPRKAQRQAYASQRDSWNKKIMAASNPDNKLFHKLIKAKISSCTTYKNPDEGDKIAESSEDILLMWRDQELSNPDRKQDFDYEKLELSKIHNNIIEQ